MSSYIIDQKLSSTPGQKMTSGMLALIFSAAIIMLMWFLRISVPNPPFDVKQGVVELDFGAPDAGFGSPDQGGPSATPPEKGSDQGDDGGSPSQAGGFGKVVTSDGEKSTVTYPPIDPPQSTSPSEDPNLAKRLGHIGKRGGTPGNPNGVNGGKGDKGYGDGPKSGVQGNHGVKPGGNGLYSYDFTNFRLNSNVRKVDADGYGTIACRVSVDCGGNGRVIEYSARGTTYTGSARGAQNVVTYFLRNSHFEKIGDKCPESGLIYIEVKASY